MNIKTYNLKNGWFSLTLPDHWEEYDDGSEGTFTFFDSKNYSGNLRISPFHYEDEKPGENKVAQLINEEIDENKEAIKIKIGNRDCAHYKKNIIEDEDELVIYYWCIGENNDIYVCSFTVKKIKEQTVENEIALAFVQDIIKSIV